MFLKLDISQIYIVSNDYILDECSDLASDLMYLAAKFIPQKKVAQALLDEGNVHAAMAKTEDCR